MKLTVYRRRRLVKAGDRTGSVGSRMEDQELSPKLSHQNYHNAEAYEDPPPQSDSKTKAITSVDDKLDKERFEIACLRQNIINEYEKKSGELLEYLKTMESAFQEQRQEYVKREAGLRKINKELRKEIGHKSKLAQDPDQALLANGSRYPQEMRKLDKTLDILRAESMQHERNYKCEQTRAEELQKFIENLQLEIQKTQGLVLHRRKKIDETRKRMDIENQEFRRKAALGWLLGCLSELFLRLDPETERGSIMKLVRKVQRELEAGNDAFIEGGMPLKLELELETIQREVRRLIGHSQALSQPTPLCRGLTEPCTPTKASYEPQPETVIQSRKILGGMGRRRWRKCNDLGQFMDKPEVMARPSTAPTSKISPARSAYPSCQRFVMNCTQDRDSQRDCCVTCHAPTALEDSSLLDTNDSRDRGMYAGQVVNLKKASRRKTLAQLRNMSNMLDEPMQAAKKLEVQGMLKGLETHMTLMLSKKWKPPFR